MTGYQVISCALIGDHGGCSCLLNELARLRAGYAILAAEREGLARTNLYTGARTALRALAAMEGREYRTDSVERPDDKAREG